MWRDRGGRGGESNGRFVGLQGLCTMHLAAAILARAIRPAKTGGAARKYRDGVANPSTPSPLRSLSPVSEVAESESRQLFYGAPQLP